MERFSISSGESRPHEEDTTQWMFDKREARKEWQEIEEAARESGFDLSLKLED